MRLATEIFAFEYSLRKRMFASSLAVCFSWTLLVRRLSLSLATPTVTDFVLHDVGITLDRTQPQLSLLIGTARYFVLEID